MLDAGRAPELIAGLSVFFDHADESRRYVLAGMPRLVANPVPQLSLLLFRGAGAGGLLQFEAMLAPTAAQLQTVARELTAAGGPVTLARPDWRSGKVHVAGWLQTAELAPALLAIGAPSLVGDPHAIVAARLDAPGAALADASLRGNALPTVLIFELETLGLAGPLGVEVEADLKAIHDRLTVEGALTTPYGRARIAKTWELAARDNLIRTKVVDESGEVESQRGEAMRRVGEDLLARMFSPFPPAERPRQLGDETVAAVELSFRLTARREEVATTARWDFRERRAIAIRHHAAASLIDLLGTSPVSSHIGFADLGELARDIVVRVEPELRKLGLAAVEADVREAGGIRTLVLTDDAPEVRLGAAQGGGPIEYRVRTRFDPAVTSAPDRESAWIQSAGSLVVVSARRLFPPRMFTVVAGRVELDWLDHVEITVETPGEPARTLVLSSDTPSADAFLAGAGDAALTVTALWHGRRNEPSRRDPPRQVRDELLVLDSPFGDSLNVLVVPLPIAGVTTVIVELRSRHDGFEHSKTVTWDAPDHVPVRVGLRRLSGSPRIYEHRIQLIRDDGTIEQKPWRTTADTTLVVGSDRDVTVRTAEVVLLGGGPASRGSLAVELVLQAGTSRTVEVLEGDRDTAMLAVLVPDGAAAPVLIVREFLNTGEIRESRWTDPPALTVVEPATVTP